MITICAEAGPDGVRVRCRSGELAPRVVAHDGHTATVALVATVALLLADDDVTVVVDIGAGVHLHLVDTAATVAHDMRGGHARWRVQGRLGPDAVLTWDAQPLIISDGADVRRTTDLELEDGAVAVLRETVVLGRSGQAGGTATLRTDVRGPAGRPWLREDLALDGNDIDPVVLGDARVLDTLTVLGAVPDHPPPDALLLAEPGLQLRELRTRTSDSSVPTASDYYRKEVSKRPVAVIGE